MRWVRSFVRGVIRRAHRGVTRSARDGMQLNRRAAVFEDDWRPPWIATRGTQRTEARVALGDRGRRTTMLYNSDPITLCRSAFSRVNARRRAALLAAFWIVCYAAWFATHWGVR